MLTVLGEPAHEEGPPVLPPPQERSVTIPVRWQGGTGYLTADLGMPDEIGQSKGLTIFAHGGGSSRQSYRNRYLAARLRLAGRERIVLFGASTGSAAALGVAAALPDSVWAVMSRSGRVDLAPTDLARVRAPALLIAGGADRDTVRLNVRAIGRLGGPATLRVVRGAGHVFEESGALGRVGDLAADWLARQERRARLRGRLRSLFGLSKSGPAAAAK